MASRTEIIMTNTDTKIIAVALTTSERENLEIVVPIPVDGGLSGNDHHIEVANGSILTLITTS